VRPAKFIDSKLSSGDSSTSNKERHVGNHDNLVTGETKQPMELPLAVPIPVLVKRELVELRVGNIVESGIDSTRGVRDKEVIERS